MYLANAFKIAIEFVIDREGGYSLDRNDPGNWTKGAVNAGILKGTKYGISAAQYPIFDIEHLTPQQATEIYRHDYWDRCHCDSLPGPVAILIFDSSVNQGVSTAIHIVQQACGVKEDGVIGPDTLQAVNKRELGELVDEVMARRMTRYGITDGFARYGLGWSHRLTACYKLALRYT